MSRKFFLNFSLLLILSLQTSCITKYLWGEKHYQENIEQFFVGSDGRYVVLIGQNYHYIFSDNSGLLREILLLKQRGILTFHAEKSYLKLDDNNDIRGYITIEGPFSILPIEDIGVLQALGLRPDAEDIISIKINLSGRRYQAKYLGPLAVMNTSYVIPIYYDQSSSIAKGVGKAAITPIAVTLDAALLIGKVVVKPLTW